MSLMTEQGWQGWKGAIAALLAGAALPLAFAPVSFFPLALLSLLLLLHCWQNVTARQAAWRGFLFGFGMFGVGVSWIYVAIHQFGQASILLAGLMTAVFVAFLALYLAALAFIFKKFTASRFSVVDSVLLFPLLWLGFELFKGWFLTGFPWLDIGVSQIDSQLAGWIPVLGSYGVSLLLAMMAGLLLQAIYQRQLPYLVFAVAIYLGGWMLAHIEWTVPTGKPIKATLIQGNVPQMMKWNPTQLTRTLALYQQRTQAHWDSDLVVWPENAVPAFYHQLNSAYLEPLREQAIKQRTDILVGLPFMEQSTQQYYNSMMVLGRSQAFYHKSHLVPFGEYVPFAWLRGLIQFFDLPMSSFSAGAADQKLLQAAGQKIGVTICYEDVFSTEVLKRVPEATLLVNASNNAWYGDSFAPHQHLQISRTRALETGRPVLRATTNGISAFIDYKGHLTRSSAQFRQTEISAWVQPRSGETPYTLWGIWGVALLSVFILLMWGYYHRSMRQRN